MDKNLKEFLSTYDIPVNHLKSYREMVDDFLKYEKNITSKETLKDILDEVDTIDKFFNPEKYNNKKHQVKEDSKVEISSEHEGFDILFLDDKKGFEKYSKSHADKFDFIIKIPLHNIMVDSIRFGKNKSKNSIKIESIKKFWNKFKNGYSLLNNTKSLPSLIDTNKDEIEEIKETSLIKFNKRKIDMLVEEFHGENLLIFVKLEKEKDVDIDGDTFEMRTV